MDVQLDVAWGTRRLGVEAESHQWVKLMNSVNRLTRKAVTCIVGRTESSLIHGRKPDCIPLLESGI